MKFKGAIFDLDGTLLDTMDVWERVDEESRARKRTRRAYAPSGAKWWRGIMPKR